MTQKRNTKILAFLTAFCLLLTMLVPAATWAAEPATFFVRSIAAGANVLPPGEYAVQPGIAAEYGYSYDPAIGQDDVCALDVLVKAHEEIFGGAFTKEEKDTYLKVTDGSISVMFGMETMNIGFTVNGTMPHTDAPAQPVAGMPDCYEGLNIAQTKVNPGDQLDFFIYQDSYAMDYYTWFTYGGQKAKEITVPANEEAELSLDGYWVAWYGLCEEESIEDLTEPMADFQIGTLDAQGAFTPIDGAVTDENGAVTLTLAEGEYILSAQGEEGEYGDKIIPPYLIVKAQESALAEDNASIAQTMMETIAADYKDSVDPWVIAEMAAFGKADSLTQKEAFAASAKEGTADLKNVIALTALGKDVTALMKEDGSKWNMIAELSKGSIPYITSAAYLLQAYDSGKYEVPEGTADREKLITYFLDQQEENGGWSTKWGAETTGMILPALAPYLDRPEVKEAVDKAVSWLSSVQTETGNFGAENSNATAMIVVGLSAVGIDADTDPRFVKGENSAIDGLMKFRTETNKFGYTNNVSENAMSTEQGFRALIAWTGMVKACGPYSVFTFGEPTEKDVLTVSVRVEGISENKLYEKALTLPGDSKVTALTVLEAAVPAEQRDIQPGAYGAYINSLYGEAANTFGEDYDGWQYMVNNEAASVGISDCEIKDGDELVFYYGGMSAMIPLEPEITHPAKGKAKMVFTTKQTTYGPAPDYTPVTEIVPIVDAKVVIGEGNAAIEKTTDEDGAVTLEIVKGEYPIQIEKYGETEKEGKFLPFVVRLAPDATVKLETTSGGGGSVGDDQIQVSFTLIGDSKHENPEEHDEFETWIAEKSYTLDSSATVKDLFETALKAAGIAYEMSGDSYVSSVNGLKEFDNGPFSGWMYKVNGTHIQKALNACTLKDGDSVIFHYTDDYTKEEDEEESKPVTPSRPSGIGGGSGGGSLPTVSGGISVDNTQQEVTEPKRFSDVSGWAEEYIYDLVERGIVQGKTEDSFAPQDLVTRAELAAMLARMSGAELMEGTESGFSDVSPEDWFAGAVAWAAEQGIVQGFEGKFDPNASVTRQDIAVMIDRYAANVANYTFPQTMEKTVFADDGQIDGYAGDAVYRLQMAGILNGRGDNLFAPLEYATREEIAKVLSVFLAGLAA